MKLSQSRREFHETNYKNHDHHEYVDLNLKIFLDLIFDLVDYASSYIFRIDLLYCNIVEECIELYGTCTMRGLTTDR